MTLSFNIIKRIVNMASKNAKGTILISDKLYLLL